MLRNEQLDGRVVNRKRKGVQMLADAETDPNIYVYDDSHGSFLFAVAMFHHFIDDIGFGERHVLGRVPDESAQ